jgi:hypothetical protein
MRQLSSVNLTQEDREAVKRWRRFMIAATGIVVLGLLVADHGYQTFFPTSPRYVQSAAR